MERRLSVIILGALAPLQAFASAGITYHGRLVKPDGAAVEESVVQFKIQIRSPGNENCLMYQEVHTRDMRSTGGVFAITINDGTATSVNTEPFTLDRVFQNRGTFSFGGTKCALGNTYSPAATDGRKLAVEFSDGTFAGFEMLPAQSINFVPMSLESMTVGGYGSGSMLRVNDGTGAPASISALTQTQYNAFVDLLAGTSPLYLSSSSSLNGANLADGSIADAKIAGGIAGSKISGNIPGNAAGFTGSLAGDVTGAQGATNVVRIRGRDIDTVAPSNGQVLKWNSSGSRWEAQNDNAGSGTVTSVTGTGPVVMSGTATDPIVGVQDSSASVKGVVQLATGADTTAGLAVQANDPRLTNARAPTAHHHDIDEIDSAGGKYFGYKPNNTACSNGELLKWNSAQARWECGTASSSESTTASNVGTAGVGVFKQLSVFDLQFKKLNAAANMTLTDDAANGKIDVAVNLGGVFSNNTGLLVSDGTQLQNKACSANEILKWLSPTGWTCAADDGITAETDPKVGANTANFLSKWNGTALIASVVSDVSGNVGIGSSNPGQKLTVAGVVESTVGGFKFPDGSVQTSASSSSPSGASSGDPVTDVRQLYGRAPATYYVKWADGTVKQNYWDGMWLLVHDEGLNANTYASYWTDTYTTQMSDFGGAGAGYGHGWSFPGAASNPANSPANLNTLVIDNLPPHTQARYSLRWHFVDSVDGEANELRIYDSTDYDAYDVFWSATKMYSGTPTASTSFSTWQSWTAASYSLAPWVAASVDGYSSIDTRAFSHYTKRFKCTHYTATDQGRDDEAIYFTHARLRIH